MTYHQESIPYIPQQVFLHTKDGNITIFDCGFTIKGDTITSHQSNPLDNVRLVNKHAFLVGSSSDYQIMISGVLTNCMPCREIDINVFGSRLVELIGFIRNTILGLRKTPIEKNRICE